MFFNINAITASYVTFIMKILKYVSKWQFKGEYKILFNRAPLGDGQWHLYNIVSDPGETLNLRDTKPEIFTALMQGYQDYVRNNGVLPIPEDYDQREQVISNALHERLIKPVQEFWRSLF